MMLICLHNDAELKSVFLSLCVFNLAEAIFQLVDQFLMVLPATAFGSIML